MNELEATVFFPTVLYTVTKKEFLPNLRKVVSERLSANTQELNELYPVKMTDSLEGDERMREFSEYVGKAAFSILVDQGCNMEGMATFFTELWCQEHYKHSAMDQHVHGKGSQIVGFYFIDVPNNSSHAVFHDPRPGKVQIQLEEKDNRNITQASNMFTVAPEEGLLVFTNAWLPHSFTRNGSNKPMRFIHFNLGVTINENPVCEVEVI